jgi:hypothetical protein
MTAPELKKMKTAFQYILDQHDLEVLDVVPKEERGHFDVMCRNYFSSAVIKVALIFEA